MSITSNTFFKLEENLLRNFLSYTPEIYHSDDEESYKMEFLEDEQAINKVTLRVNNEDTKIISFNKPEFQGVISKNTILDDNFFHLIDAKVELTSDQFILLIEKYSQKLRDLIYYTEEVIYNFKYDFKNKLPENILFGFDTQLRFLNEHYLEFAKRFEIETEDSVEKKDEDDKESKILNNLDKSGSGNEDETKTLAPFISHEKSEEIEKIIIENFKGLKGKTYRCIIEYLVKQGLITLEQGNRQDIYDAFKNMFEHDIGKYASMWGYEVVRGKDKTYSNIRSKFMRLLKKADIDI